MDGPEGFKNDGLILLGGLEQLASLQWIPIVCQEWRWTPINFIPALSWVFLAMNSCSVASWAEVVVQKGSMKVSAKPVGKRATCQYLRAWFRWHIISIRELDLVSIDGLCAPLVQVKKEQSEHQILGPSCRSLAEDMVQKSCRITYVCRHKKCHVEIRVATELPFQIYQYFS